MSIITWITLALSAVAVFMAVQTVRYSRQARRANEETRQHLERARRANDASQRLMQERRQRGR
jgi:biopolymer transport protein ExbB/TolQ